MTRGSPLVLLLAVALYLGFRAWVLHTNFDAVAIPIFEVPVMGNLAALAVADESGAPLERYYDNCGGHVLTGLLAAPLYGLLGDSYLTLKLVPLTLGLATLLLLWRVLARYYDRRAADLFALLFVLGPPTLAKYSLLAKGNHFENLFFQVVVLALFLRLHARGTRPRSLFWASAAAGFALFFYFGSVVLIASLALVHLAVRGRRTLSDLPPALLGLALGLAPLAWFQAATDGRPGSFLSNKLRGAPTGGWSQFAERIEAFFTDVLPRAGVFEDLGPFSARIAETAFLALFALAWLLLAFKLGRRVLALRRRPDAEGTHERELVRLEAWKLLPFVLYLPLFALIVSASRFDFDPYGPPVEVGRFRYLVPHFLLALVAIALAAAHLSRGTRRTRLAAGALASAALLTGAFTLPIVDFCALHTGFGAGYSGHWFLQYPNVVLRDPLRSQGVRTIPWDPVRVTAEFEGLGPAHRREAWTGMGHYGAWAQRLGKRAKAGSETRLALAELLAPYPTDCHPALARGAGTYLRSGVPRAELASELAALAEEGHPLVPQLIEGLCLNLRYPLVRLGEVLVAESAEFEAAIPVALRADWRRGQGVQVGRIAARGLAPDRALGRAVSATVSAEDEGVFWFGFGFGMAEGAEGGAPPAAFDEAVPEAARTHALDGYRAALRAIEAQAAPSAPRQQ